MSQVDPYNEDTYKVIVVRSTFAEAKLPETEILKDVAAAGYDEDATFAIKLALEEAMTNAVRHGNRSEADKSITVRWAVTPDIVVICVRDEGVGFEPEEIPDPTSPERLSLPSGRGIMLMKAYMNEVAYRDHGREVRMAKFNAKRAKNSKKKTP